MFVHEACQACMQGLSCITNTTPWVAQEVISFHIGNKVSSTTNRLVHFKMRSSLSKRPTNASQTSQATTQLYTLPLKTANFLGCLHMGRCLHFKRFERDSIMFTFVSKNPHVSKLEALFLKNFDSLSDWQLD